MTAPAPTPGAAPTLAPMMKTAFMLAERLAQQTLNELPLIAPGDDGAPMQALMGFMSGVACRQPGGLETTAAFYRQVAQNAQAVASSLSDIAATFHGAEHRTEAGHA